MLLAIDAGNTNIVLGVYEGDVRRASWRLSTNSRQTGDEYGVFVKTLLEQAGFADGCLSGIVLASVVPALTASFCEMSQRYFGLIPLVVGPGIRTGLNIFTDNPREVGADRIVNAVGGFSLYGGPLIIVDFGTATTFDAVSQEGDYLGGVISPGVGISTEALVHHAAKLSRVELVKPDRVIGKDTVSSMQSGIFYGFVSQVDGIVRRMATEFPTRPHVVATGGLAQSIGAAAKTVEKIDMFLTLEGLRIIFQRNKGKDK